MNPGKRPIFCQTNTRVSAAGRWIFEQRSNASGHQPDCVYIGEIEQYRFMVRTILSVEMAQAGGAAILS